MTSMYPAFVWWQGVIENRSDPDKMGRYKVRIFGYHTRDKVVLPTIDLPWAIPMQPVTSAAISGVGTSPTGLVEGSTVIGFFADGNDAQIPIIMGSWGCMSLLPENEDGSIIRGDREITGFYDPRTAEEAMAVHGLYPREDLDKSGTNGLGEPDSSRLARGSAAVQAHYSYVGKEATRIKTVAATDEITAVAAIAAVAADPDNGIEAVAAVAAVSAAAATDGYKGIPKATAPLMTMYDLKETSIKHPKAKGSLLLDDAIAKNIYEPTPVPKYDEEFWEEPASGGTDSVYPYNHVTESESGHVREVDDTPGHERIHNYHKSGTYDEINATGTKAVKIVGDNYEIILKDKNLFVKGDFNVTVEGDYNLNVLGNKYEDVLGHSFTTIRGNKVTKVQGNSTTEIMSDESRLTAGDKFITAQKSLVTRVGTNYIHNVGGRYNLFANIGITTTCLGDYAITVVPTTATEVVGKAIVPIKSNGSFKLFTLGGIDIATSVLPVVEEGTLPSISLQSSYINTNALMGIIEVVGPEPSLLEILPAQPVGKYTQVSIVDEFDFAVTERLLVGSKVSNIAAGFIWNICATGFAVDAPIIRLN